MGEDKLKDLLSDIKVRKDPQLERMEDVDALTEIIHRYRVKNARSYEIANAILKFVKEG